MMVVQLQVAALRAVWNPLENPPWSWHHCPEWKLVPFTPQDIKTALLDPELETLGAESNEIWGDRRKPNHQYCSRRRHLLRIAYLVKHNDENPIGMEDVTKLKIYDGWHRLAAAIYRGDETIAAVQVSRQMSKPSLGVAISGGKP
jgi:hypothetical protein